MSAGYRLPPKISVDQQNVYLRSPLSSPAHARRPRATGLQAQPLPRPPLSRTLQDEEPRDRSLHRPTPVGDRLGRLLLDRPSPVLTPLGRPPDSDRTDRHL